MEINSPAATIWWTFWQSYLCDHVRPVVAAHESVKVDRAELNDALGQDLEAWTLGDPNNSGVHSTAASSNTAFDVMRTAFASTVSTLTKPARLGSRAPGPGAGSTSA